MGRFIHLRAFVNPEFKVMFPYRLWGLRGDQRISHFPFTKREYCEHDLDMFDTYETSFSIIAYIASKC